MRSALIKLQFSLYCVKYPISFSRARIKDPRIVKFSAMFANPW